MREVSVAYKWFLARLSVGFLSLNVSGIPKSAVFKSADFTLSKCIINR